MADVLPFRLVPGGKAAAKRATERSSAQRLLAQLETLDRGSVDYVSKIMQRLVERRIMQRAQ